MRPLRLAPRLLVVLALVVLPGVLGVREPASAATGDLVADVYCPDGENNGVSVAFDGTFLYYTNFHGTYLHRIETPPPGASTCAPAGSSGHADFPIVGPSGINAFSFDTKNGSRFWGAAIDGLSIWTLTVPSPLMPVSSGTLQFVINPATDLPGNCDVDVCNSLITGLAYDGAGSGSLWYAPDVSMRVYQFAAAAGSGGRAILLGSFDVDTPPNDMAANCGFNYISGVAAGAGGLYLQADLCNKYFQYSKTGTKLAVLPNVGTKQADSECDGVTYTRKFPIGKEVVWIRDQKDGHIRAFEVPAGTCPSGAVVLPSLPPLLQVPSGALP